MSKSIKQHLADLSGNSVRGLDYSKLASHFGGSAKMRDRQDLRNEMERERVVALDEPHINMMRRAIEEALEQESAEVNGTLPVISVFEAAQEVKGACKRASRDVGLLNLSTHLERRWKAHKEAHLTASDILTLKDHYHRNFPKSAASSVIEGFTKAGWLDLEVGHLMEIAGQIRSQDDFDYYIKEAGLHTNNPYNKKARNFILAMLNGKVGQEDEWDELVQKDEQRRFDEKQMKLPGVKSKRTPKRAWDSDIPEVEEMRSDLSQVGLYYDASVAGSQLNYVDGVENPDEWVMLEGYKDMMSHRDESNMEVVLEDLKKSYAEFLIEHRGEYAVRVYENGEPTNAYNYLYDIIAALSDYPVLDDEDVSRREFEATIDSIESNGSGVIADVVPSDWSKQVFDWLWDNNQEALEPDTDGSVWVPEEAIKEAVEALGFADPDADWDVE